MTNYVPIFKGKQGEFQAWSYAAPSVHTRSRALFEVVPERGAQADLTKFLKYARKNWPQEQVLTYDVGALAADPLPGVDQSPMEWLSRELHSAGIAARPVVRLDDVAETIAAATAVDELHGQGVCIRVGSEERAPNVAACVQETPALLARLGIAPSNIDMLCDWREVDDVRTVDLIAPLAIDFIDWAAETAWRSVTVAAGAFPASLTNFPKGEHTAIVRHDADLWWRLAGGPNTPDFGDYVVAHPSMPSPAPRGPLPNLRHTCDGEWWIWRAGRDLPGNESMRTLCERVVASPAFYHPEFSWGDGEIHRVARGVDGPGGAAQWRAWGSSRHLAVVTDRLATLNAP